MGTNTMLSSAIKFAYVLDDGIWRPADCDRDFGYSDGDEAEERIAKAVAECSDVSLFSRALREHQVDWPSKYHLSASRANLLRPLSELLKGRVLEVGSGCGAISRYLGEMGADLIALEGSERRARITASRCRDLPNVRVVNDVLESFASEGGFDVVSLIGVLEYARVYGKSEDAADQWLRKARGLLADEGCLVVAIENQLGLKYFAGMPEDHFGKAMYGISDNYHGQSVATYGRQRLARMFESAGFEQCDFLLPFPDYKFPLAVLLPQAYDGSHLGFDAGALAGQTASHDPQIPYAPLFSLERAWPLVGDNGLLADMANSFLVVARKKRKGELPQRAAPIAYHFATERVPAFCKQVTFTPSSPPGRIVVERQPLVPDSSGEHGRPISMRLDEEEYVRGRLHTSALEEIVTREGWRAAEVADWLVTWKQALLDHALAGVDQAELPGCLPGIALDALPRNLMVDRDGATRFIDLEWVWHADLEIGYMVYRAIVGSFTAMTAVAQPEDVRHLRLEALIHDVTSIVGVPLAGSDLERFIDLDSTVTRLVYGRDSGLSLREFAKLELKALPNVSRMSGDWQGLVSEAAQQTADLTIRLASFAKDIHALKKVVEEKDRELESVLTRLEDEGESAAQALDDLAAKSREEVVRLLAEKEEEIRCLMADHVERERRKDEVHAVEMLRAEERLREVMRDSEIRNQESLSAWEARVDGLRASHAGEIGKVHALVEAGLQREALLQDEIRLLAAASHDKNLLVERTSQLLDRSQAGEQSLATSLAEARYALGERDKSLRQEIEGLQTTLTAREELLRQIISSNSWRITKPLRFFRRSLHPRSIKQSLGRCLRFIYLRLPVPESWRLRVKSAVFRALPTVFSGTDSYQRWKAFDPTPAKIEHVAVDEALVLEAVVERAHTESSVWRRYAQRVLELPASVDDQYVPIAVKRDPGPPAARVIAFYLPQFHPIPENDMWWGRGFTEWTNVAKAVPQFVGHYQPHLPGELGFYDLRVEDVMRRQAELAKLYGIEGFCFHYYWFGGRRLLERPLEQLLRSDIDLPFCVCWANENWTRRWDGLESEILIAQNYSESDDLAFIESIVPLMRDTRYIRVDGRPLLILYRPSLLPDAMATLERWRNHCRSSGLGEIFLCMVQFDKLDPREYGFDAAVEFPPHKVAVGLRSINDELDIASPSYEGSVVDYADVVRNSLAQSKPDYAMIRGVFPGWDNEARKPGRGYTVARSTPARYRAWLRSAIDYAQKNPVRGESLVFVNAWNEWAEGAHLEPDRRFGYAYLEATRQALRKPASPRTPERVVLVVHAFYPELLPEMFADLTGWTVPYRLIVTTIEEKKAQVQEALDAAGLHAEVRCFENHGRDILPFLEVVKGLKDEDLVLKLHTKRSLHRQDGEAWRRDMLDKLLKPEAARGIFDAFRRQNKLGLVAPEGHILSMSTYWGANADTVYRLSGMMGSDPVDPSIAMFAAGSMFYVRTRAIDALLSLGLGGSDFEPEAGQVDGTMAHAIERCFSIATCSAGYYLASSASPLNEAYGSQERYAYAKSANEELEDKT